MSTLNDSTIANLDAVCQCNTRHAARRSFLRAIPVRYPSVYKFRLENVLPEDLYSFFAEEMLSGVSTRCVKKAIIDYVQKTVQYAGWSVIWRSSTESSGLSFPCDLIAKVLILSDRKLEADVLLRNVLTDLSDAQDKKAEAEKLLEEKFFTVPLPELYVINEDDHDQEYLKTAIVIEHVRFFFQYLWRPWDEYGDDFPFVDTFLRTRLNFFMEFKNKKLSLKAMDRAKYLLERGWKVKEQLEKLHSVLSLDESETELIANGLQVGQFMKLQLEMEDLQREMEIMENPLSRALLVDNISKCDTEKSRRKIDPPVAHVVAHKFHHDAIRMLHVKPETEMEFHHTFSNAIDSCYSGDTIFLLPGIYLFTGVTLEDKNLTIKGTGNANSTVLECEGNADIMFCCASGDVTFENVTFQSLNHIQSIFTVLNGKVELRGCVVNGGNALVTFVAFKSSQLYLKGCKITESGGENKTPDMGKCLVNGACYTHRGEVVVQEVGYDEFSDAIPDHVWHGLQGQTKGDGIKLLAGSAASIIDTQIYNSKDCGILIEAADDMSRKDSVISLHTENVVIKRCGSCAISVELGASDGSTSPAWHDGDSPDDVKCISKFPWLDAKLNGIISLENGSNVNILSRAGSTSSLDSATEEQKREEYAFIRSFLEDDIYGEPSTSDDEEEGTSDVDCSKSKDCGDPDTTLTKAI